MRRLMTLISLWPLEVNPAERGEQGLTSRLSKGLFESEQKLKSNNEKFGFIYGWL